MTEGQTQQITTNRKQMVLLAESHEGIAADWRSRIADIDQLVSKEAELADEIASLKNQLAIVKR